MQRRAGQSDIGTGQTVRKSVRSEAYSIKDDNRGAGAGEGKARGLGRAISGSKRGKGIGRSRGRVRRRGGWGGVGVNGSLSWSRMRKTGKTKRKVTLRTTILNLGPSDTKRNNKEAPAGDNTHRGQGENKLGFESVSKEKNVSSLRGK